MREEKLECRWQSVASGSEPLQAQVSVGASGRGTRPVYDHLLLHCACKMLASAEGVQGSQNHTGEEKGIDEVICKRLQSLLTRAADSTR